MRPRGDGPAYPNGTDGKAAERGTTLRALVEEGLREILEAKPVGTFVLRDASVDGKGLRADVRDGSWERILELVYEGRGG